AGEAVKDLAAERGGQLLENRCRLVRIEMSEQQRNRLRMLIPDERTDLLRVRVTQIGESLVVAKLRLDALENRSCLLRPHGLLEHLARVLDAALRDRVGRSLHLLPLEHDRARDVRRYTIEPRDL